VAVLDATKLILKATTNTNTSQTTRRIRKLTKEKHAAIKPHLNNLSLEWKFCFLQLTVHLKLFDLPFLPIQHHHNADGRHFAN